MDLVGFQSACANVTAPFDMMPVFRSKSSFEFAFTDKDLKKASTFYSLGARNLRCTMDAADLRKVWAQSCEDATRSFLVSFPPAPLLRMAEFGALTSHLKLCYKKESAFKARVAIDLDCATDGSSKPMPTAEMIHGIVCDFFQEHVEEEIDFAEEECIVFLGSSLVKNRTCHAIFPNLSFAQKTCNILGKKHALSGLFNKRLADLGLESDFSICTSGLRWEFGDKFDPKTKTWRGSVSLPFFFNIDALDALTWRSLSEMVDPHAIVGDEAFNREITWRAIEGSAGKRSRTGDQLPSKPKPSASGAPAGLSTRAPQEEITDNNVESRLAAAFPELQGVEYVRHDDGKKLCPQTRWCPFKTEDSSDNPAHEHGSPKLYIFVKPTGEAVIHCGVCQGESITVPGPLFRFAWERQLIASFNLKWARITDCALLLPQPNQDGSFTAHRKLSFRQFTDATRTNAPLMKVNGRKMPESEYWWGHPAALSFPKGFIFDPSGTHDPGYFNTWRGWNPRMLRVAETMKGLSNDELKAEWTETANLMLYNLCNEDMTLMTALVGFFTDMILNPGRKPKWAVAVHGPQGTGKGMTGQFFKAICGVHGIQNDGTMLSEDFNGYAMESIFLFIDEGVTHMNPTISAKIKKMVTETEQVSNRKFVDKYAVNTVMRIYVSSNDNPNFLEDGDRRWLVIRSGFRLPDFKELIPKIVEECESLRGPAAFYLLALRAGSPPVDENGTVVFNHAFPPRTGERWNVLYSKLDSYDLFIYHRLCLDDDEDFLPHCSLDVEAYSVFGDVPNLGLNAHVFGGGVLPKAIMWQAFLHHFNGVAPRNATDTHLWRRLNACSGDEGGAVFRFNRVGGKRAFVMPDREWWREKFCHLKGVSEDIYDKWKK